MAILPPGVTAADFASACREFAAAAGAEWVLTGDDDLKPYRDHYSPVPLADDELIPSAAVAPGTHALTLKDRGQKPGLLERRDDLPADLIKAVVRSGVASMPPFRETEVTNADLDAVAAYLADSARRHNEEEARK